MSRRVTLPTVLKNLYAENSRFDVGPPAYILKELEQNVLALSDIEISDDDVPLLCRFFNHPQACKLIKRIQIDRTSSKKVHVRRPDSAFNSNGCKLMKELFKFISNAKALQSVCFESLDIPIEALPLLGKSLIASSSAILWLGIKDCSIGGDEGLRILTHYIGKLKLQVLAVEQCELTDASLVYIASILKAQQNNLDSLYWNATLRVDPSKRGALWNASEIDAVYRCGLVALSLYGNNLELRDVYTLTRVLRNNHWLLGVNLANNNIGRESMLAFTDELMSNSVLQTLLLKDNPGLDVHIASVMYAAIQRNTMDVTTDTTREVVEDLELRHSSGYRRLELQTPRIALLLRTWQQLQHIETSVPQMAYPHIHAAASTTSAATMGSNSPTAIAIRSRKNIRAAAAAKSSTTSASASASKSGTPKVGTRKAFEAELRAHLSNPYGYSALDLANDQAPSAPVSPYRQSKSGEYSYASFLNNAVSPAGIGLFTGRPNRSQAQFSGLLDGRSSLHRSFMSQQQDHDGPEEVDPNASTSRFNMVDLQQPLFASGRSTGSGIGGYAGGGTGGVVGNPLSDSIQLSVNSRDDLAVEDHSQLGSARDRDFALTGEALDLAIPTVSPVKSSSDYYIGMDAKRPPKNPELHSQAENDEEDQQQVREESWGNIDWPVSDDHQGYNHTENDDNLLSGRPPSRISIRHHRSSSCSNGGRSSSPSPDRVDGAYSAQKRELQLRMRQEMDDYAMEQYAESYAAGRPIPAHRHRTSTTPEILRSSSHASFAATSEPNYRRHTNSSASGAVNKPGTKPFYAGGQARPASPVKYTRAELAVLYGLAPSSRSLPRQQQDMRYSSPYVERRKKIIKRRRSAPTGRVREALPSSAVPVVLGKARGSTGTRIRARSADRLGRGVGGVDSRTAVGGHDSSSSSGVRSSVRVINELSVTVLNATRNLETVSTKLKDVIEGLSTSMDMNLTIQRELLSNSMMNTTTNTTFMNSNTSTGTGGVKSSHAWASPVGLSSVNATPQSHALFHRPPLSGVKTSPAEGPSSSQSTGGAGSKVAASRYRDLSSSPVTFNGAAHHQQESSGIECGQGANGHRVDRESTGGSEPLFAPRDANDSQEQEQEQDSQLRELVRNRMEQKLRSILNENS